MSVRRTDWDDYEYERRQSLADEDRDRADEQEQGDDE